MHVAARRDAPKIDFSSNEFELDLQLAFARPTVCAFASALASQYKYQPINDSSGGSYANTATHIARWGKVT